MNRPLSHDRILRMSELPSIVGIQRTHIYELIRRNEFPRGVKLGERARGWRERDINAWIAKRKTA